MRNRKLIMTLATPLLVAAPLAIVISCGEEQKQPQAAQQTAQQQVTTPKVDAPKDASNTGVSAPVENKPTTQEQPKVEQPKVEQPKQVEQPKVDTPTVHSVQWSTITPAQKIAKPTQTVSADAPRHATGDYVAPTLDIKITNDFDASKVDPEILKLGLGSVEKMQSITYTVSGVAKGHSVKFVFDKATNVSDEIIRKMITRFVAETNFGYGWLTTDNIIFTAGKLLNGAGGYGGAAKDILLQFPDLNEVPAYLNTQQWLAVPDQRAIAIANSQFPVLQNVFNTLKHEYGHHETSSFTDASGTTQAKNLVANNVIGSTMFNAVNDWNATTSSYVANATKSAAEKARLDALFQSQFAGKLENQFGKLFGTDTAGFAYNVDFTMDMGYHMSTMEFLNRVMNIIELTPFDDAHKGTVYAFPDMVKYELESRKMFDLASGVYTQDAHNLVKLYGKYVYGYDADVRSKVENGEFKAFSANKFDFIQDGQNVINADRVESHYIDKDKMFGTTSVVNHDFAYHARVSSDLTSLHFYEDTNNNGKFDAGTDKEVTL